MHNTKGTTDGRPATTTERNRVPSSFPRGHEQEEKEKKKRAQHRGRQKRKQTDQKLLQQQRPQTRQTKQNSTTPASSAGSTTVWARSIVLARGVPITYMLCMWDKNNRKYRNKLRSKKHPWHHVLYHQPPTAAVSRVCSRLVFYFARSKICMFRHNQMFEFKYCFALGVPKKSIATTRNCRLFGPGAVRAVVPWREDVFVPAFGASMSGHELVM